MGIVNPRPIVAATIDLPDDRTPIAIGATWFLEANVSPPDNCRYMMLLNLDAVNRILLFCALDASEFSPALMAINNSTVIPASAALTLDLGPIGDRWLLAGDDTGGAMTLYLMAETGTSVPVNLTFLQGKGAFGLLGT